MITFLGLVAALVALLTGCAMLKDTHITHGDRLVLRGILERALRGLRARGLRGLELAELAIAVRLVLRLGVLVMIVASSGVAFLETLAGPEPGRYDVMLRCFLAAYMAMQAPCTWIRWITRGDRRHAHRPLSADHGHARRNAH
ncbi:hypothetical protein AB4Y64_09840 [Lysobacter sp. TAF61]|uniref:hypothetical protein n=1 Tax=Lysobacter sp. TAF61 TaxID=3233072 RepID=UPI003F955EBF